ncbi:hypothetical protein HNQ60_001476 [Povalibacter uvarum]|uniref:Uncharacterized protein n=1 Tax=Povalibacter uvarum TaxID=732238 RepID=A0A841HK31_9GAMM|nr:hypothetical protein [Povalibacter uvarum]MBB6092598.1 hypothetical protein [Povalibacter uvarum]
MHPSVAMADMPRVTIRAAALLMISTAGYAAESPTPQPIAVSTQRTLDLRAPDITRIFSREEIDRVLRATRDPDTIEEVEVARERAKDLPSATPNIPAGIIAPFWALANPTQAWRIFLPLPPDQARGLDAMKADATDSYRPPVLPPQ